jgi:predicted Zn-dependent protease
MSVPRLLLVALATVICAGFAIGIWQAQYSGTVGGLLAKGARLTPAQQRTAASDLRSAAFAYPGQDVSILAAQVALRERHFARAMSIARAVTRAEPDNVRGWAVLAAAGIVARDRDAVLRAKREEIRLDPIDARPR